MMRLGLGILLFAGVHFLPSVAPRFRASVIARVGENPYKLAFTILSFTALFLIITGWKAASVEPLYLPPDWGRYAALAGVWAAFVLLPAPYFASNVRRLLRHPQLTGVAVWGIAHLLANGEARSVLLFGGFTAWAVTEMLLINRREGAWSRSRLRPDRRSGDLRLIGVGTVLFVVTAYGHAWLFGVPPLAGVG